MDDKKKRFVVPDAEIIDFNGEDIITTSGEDSDLWPEGGGDGINW